MADVLSNIFIFTALLELEVPVITSTVADQAIALDEAYSLQLEATGNPAPTWSVTSGTLPAGLSINPTSGLISGTPTNVQAAMDIVVSASNSEGSDTIIISYEVEDRSTPVWDTIPEQLLVVGETHTLNLDTYLTAPDNTVVSLNSGSHALPVGTSLSSNEISGTITDPSDAVNFDVTFLATTPYGNTATQEVDYTVADDMRGALIATSNELSADSDYGQLENIWTVASGLPTGIGQTNMVLNIPNSKPDRYFGLWAVLEIDGTETDAVMLPYGKTGFVRDSSESGGRDTFTLAKDDARLRLSSDDDYVDVYYISEMDGADRLVLAGDSGNLPDDAVVKIYAGAI